MSGKFVAIDFETANPSLASICQVGIVSFCDGQIVNQWKTLIDPEDWFDEMNVSIHGIDEAAVRGAPKLPELIGQFDQLMREQVVVCHTHFDRAAFSQALAKYEIPPFPCTWLNSALVVRRCWDQFAKRGYGLPNVCGFLGIEYQAHDALEDARAAGLVLLRAMAHTGMDLSQWMDRVTLRVDLTGATPIARDGNPDGFLYGEELVITGTLTSMTKAEAATLASRAGCKVSETFRKTTTILVVGDQDVTKLAGHAKSKKHRDAEAANENGRPVRILKEADFATLIAIQAAVAGTV